MSENTHGKIIGYISADKLIEFIKNTWDENVSNNITRSNYHPVSECNWDCKVNEHSDDPDNWYSIDGYINFKYHNENRSLFYMYDSLTHLEDLEEYKELGLEELITTETTHLSLGHWGSSVDILKSIIQYFGGGWIDANDCDDIPYYKVNV